MNTIPATGQEQGAAAPHLILEPTVIDEITGARWVHKDYQDAIPPWFTQDHIYPVCVTERFGDVESWAAYISSYSSYSRKKGFFATWSGTGLRAVLDYPFGRQWIAEAPFVHTPEWQAWSSAAKGQAIPHVTAVEFLDDHAPDIHEPDSATLLNLLRNLRSNVNCSAATELRADGTSAVRFSKDSTVRSGSQTVELPHEITIAIPVLRGHRDDDGQVVRYKLVLKLRASVGQDAHLGLRLVMPAAETVLEQVWEERVNKARGLIGADHSILRAAG